MSFDVVCQGLCSVDVLLRAPGYPARDEKVALLGFERQAGGQAATVAAALARWGLRSAFLGAVGDDEPGRFCLGQLRGAGVDVTQCRTVAGSSSQQAFIVVDPEGGRTIFWHRAERLEQRAFDLPSAGWLHLDGHDLEAAEGLARSARAKEIPICLDLEDWSLAHERLASLCRFVVCDGTAANRMAGSDDPDAALSVLEGLGVELAGVTAGAQGAFGRWRGQRLRARHPLPREELVDTTGAGDLFHAGLVYALSRGQAPPEAFRFAAAAGALACRRLGVFPAIPELGEVRRAAEAC